MKKLLLVLCLLPTLLLCSCGESAVSENAITTVILYKDNVLRMKLDASVSTLDPAFVATDNELFLARLLYNGLLKKENGSLTGDLALYWDCSDDGLTHTFRLRDGISFSNGSPITPLDVKSSWERILRVNSPYSYLFENIKGAKELAAGKAMELSGIGIEGSAIIVELENPDYRFAHKLCHIGASVCSRTDIMSLGEGFGKPASGDNKYAMPCATGIFRLSEWQEGKELALSANKYSAASAPVNRLEIDFATEYSDALLKMQWGELDAVYQALPSQLPAAMKDEEQSSLCSRSRCFSFVLLDEQWQAGKTMPLSDTANRLALLSLLEPEALNEEVNEGSGIINTGLCDYWYSVQGGLTKYRDFNAVGAYSFSIELPLLSIACGKSSYEQKLAGAIAQRLKAIGVESELYIMDYPALLQARAEHKAAITVARYADKGNDLYDFFRLFISGSVSLPEPDAALLQSVLTANQPLSASEADSFVQLEKELCERGCFKLLWFEQFNCIYNGKLRHLDGKLGQIIQ